MGRLLGVELGEAEGLDEIEGEADAVAVGEFDGTALGTTLGLVLGLDEGTAEG